MCGPRYYTFLPGGLLSGLIDLASRIIRHLHHIGRKSLFKPDLEIDPDLFASEEAQHQTINIPLTYLSHTKSLLNSIKYLSYTEPHHNSPLLSP